MPDWDPNDAEPAIKHLLMAVIEIDQVIKDHNTRLEEIDASFDAFRNATQTKLEEMDGQLDFAWSMRKFKGVFVSSDLNGR